MNRYKSGDVYLYLTNQCPNRCKYCYESYNNSSISTDYIDKCIHRYDPRKLVFFGGEPLLRLDLMEYTLNKYQGTRQFHVITSSMANWKDFIDLYFKYKFTFQVSWDGYRDSRVDVNGCSIANRVLANINYAISRGCRFIIKTVINNSNIEEVPKLNKLYNRLYKEFGVDGQFCLARGQKRRKDWYSLFDTCYYCTFESMFEHPYTMNVNMLINYLDHTEAASCSGGTDISFFTDGTSLLSCDPIAYTKYRYDNPDKFRTRCSSDDCRVDNCKYSYMCDGGCKYERMIQFKDEWHSNHTEDTCKMMEINHNMIERYLSSIKNKDYLYKILFEAMDYYESLVL